MSGLVWLLAWVAVLTAAPAAARAEPAATRAAPCAEGSVLASGAPDPSIFSRHASRGVRAEWCETYDARGRAVRSGPYRERHANGRLRLEARYVAGALDGPILAFDEEGFLFVRGELRGGRWVGTLSLLRPNGTVWLAVRYANGQLEGPVSMQHPDGALAAETRYRAGREHGLARSFYPTAYGGGVLSAVRFERGEPVGEHRLFDEDGVLLAPLAPDDPVFATVGPVPTRPPGPAGREADAKPSPPGSVASVATR